MNRDAWSNNCLYYTGMQACGRESGQALSCYPMRPRKGREIPWLYYAISTSLDYLSNVHVCVHVFVAGSRGRGIPVDLARITMRGLHTS